MTDRVTSARENAVAVDAQDALVRTLPLEIGRDAVKGRDHGGKPRALAHAYALHAFYAHRADIAADDDFARIGFGFRAHLEGETAVHRDAQPAARRNGVDMVVVRVEELRKIHAADAVVLVGEVLVTTADILYRPLADGFRRRGLDRHGEKVVKLVLPYLQSHGVRRYGDALHGNAHRVGDERRHQPHHQQHDYGK